MHLPTKPTKELSLLLISQSLEFDNMQLDVTTLCISFVIKLYALCVTKSTSFAAVWVYKIWNQLRRIDRDVFIENYLWHNLCNNADLKVYINQSTFANYFLNIPNVKTWNPVSEKIRTSSSVDIFERKLQLHRFEIPALYIFDVFKLISCFIVRLVHLSSLNRTSETCEKYFRFCTLHSPQIISKYQPYS